MQIKLSVPHVDMHRMRTEPDYAADMVFEFRKMQAAVVAAIGTAQDETATPLAKALVQFDVLSAFMPGTDAADVRAALIEASQSEINAAMDELMGLIQTMSGNLAAIEQPEPVA